MPYEVHPVIMETIENINDTIEADMDEQMLTSHLASFRVGDNGDVEASFLKADDTHKGNADRQRITMTLEHLTHMSDHSTEAAIRKKIDACETLKTLLEAKFVDFTEVVFKSMMWFDPKNWSNDKQYGFEQIKELARYFADLLSAANFDESMCFKEWRSFKNYVNANHRGAEATFLWEKVFQYKRLEYPNLCLLAEIIYCLSGSNSTVERAFSLLTLLLSDKRLSMRHATMEQVMMININDKIWTSLERESIITAAVHKYLAKQRLKRVDGPPKKCIHLDVVTIESDDDDDNDEAEVEQTDESSVNSSSEEDSS